MATDQDLVLSHVITRTWTVLREENITYTKCYGTKCSLPPYRIGGKKCGRSRKNAALCERHYLRWQGCLCDDGQHRDDEEPALARNYARVAVKLPAMTRTESDSERDISSSGQPIKPELKEERDREGQLIVISIHRVSLRLILSGSNRWTSLLSQPLASLEPIA